MSKLEQLKEKAKGLEAKDPKKAIEIWLEALNQQSDGEANPDLSIYNRIGDLFIKLRDPGQAADYYDQAVDKYAELGFHNNAIAMCNKVLRNAPARQATYLKLAKLYAAKGFMAEAKQNFVEYAERMQRVGKIEHAFAALKEFTDISPESESLREMLAEHLKMYGADPGKRASAAGSRVSTAAPKSAPHAGDDNSKSGKRKTSSLVFLDLDEPRGAKAPPVPPAKPAAPPPPPKLKPLGRPPVGKAAAEPPRVKPVVPKRPSAPSPASGPGGSGGPGKRKTVVEVPPLELEPDFESSVTEAAHEIDDKPVKPGFIQTEDDTSIAPGRRSGFIDLGIDEKIGRASCREGG